MQLDELKAAWAQQAHRIDQLEAQALQAWQQPRQHAVRRRLRWFGGLQVVWLLVWIVMTALAAGFWVEHRQVPQLLLTGLALHVYGIAAIWVSITRALLAVHVDRAEAPVLIQQQRLARLRRFTAVTELGLGLPWFWLWLLALQWLGMQWLGVDLYALAPAWFLGTLGFGVVMMLVSAAAARWMVQRLPADHRLQRLLDSLSGQSLHRAQQQLQELQQGQ
ncbi:MULTISPECIES: hypothetical protein [Stenotrophomonas]|uniref:hypothetical protein n=1 Tax=Stenotrophomonas TaxID=40323 RepID=UPI000770356B|nr:MULTISPECIES: hypothetical protein [Stenotrophomonas]AMJ57957.1 hypothetical protein AXG53_15955 [Stenotrophomonas sp. KCTC 12332]